MIDIKTLHIGSHVEYDGKSDGKHYYTLFLTKKKIKNFTE